MADAVIRREPQAFAEDRYDLIVVGGGIHGTCALLEAARRGRRVLLLESCDFGGRTSWNSLRIVHGGLRYLQSGDLTRFFQSVRERRWFFRTFPELVRPLPCVMPLTGKGLHRPLVLRAALAMNDLLSFHRNRHVDARVHLPRGRVLSTEEVLDALPAEVVRNAPQPGGSEGGDLEKGAEKGTGGGGPTAATDWAGGALWYDGVMTSPQRLLMEILRWGVRAGGRALNYVRVLDARGSEGGGIALTAQDRMNGVDHHFQADKVLLAGPRFSLGMADERTLSSDVPVTLAFNVLLDRVLPTPQALAVRAPVPGAQTLFLHPHGPDATLAGTWHATVSAPGNLQEASAQALGSFLTELNRALPGWEVEEADVLRILPGLLPGTDAAKADLAVRPYLRPVSLVGTSTKALHLAGVKYTTAPATARMAVDRLLGGGIRPPDGDGEAQAGSRRRKGAESRRGRQDRARGELQALPEPDSVLDSESGELHPDVARVCREESVMSWEDLVMRRTDWGLDPRVGEPLVKRLVEAGEVSFLSRE